MHEVAIYTLLGFLKHEMLGVCACLVLGVSNLVQSVVHIVPVLLLLPIGRLHGGGMPQAAAVLLRRLAAAFRSPRLVVVRLRQQGPRLATVGVGPAVPGSSPPT